MAVFLYPKFQLMRYPSLQALFLDPVTILSYYLFPYLFKVRQRVPSLREGASLSFVDALNCAHTSLHSPFIKLPSVIDWSGHLFSARTWPIYSSCKDEKLRPWEVKAKSHIAQVKWSVKSRMRPSRSEFFLVSAYLSFSHSQPLHSYIDGHFLESSFHWVLTIVVICSSFELKIPY